MTPRPSHLFAVCDPQGHIVHTTVALDKEYAVELWLEDEQGWNRMMNHFREAQGESQTCTMSWEGFEALGYSVIPVVVSPNEDPSYSIIKGGSRLGIKCHRCGRISYHPKDVSNHYCGHCHVFHKLACNK